MLHALSAEGICISNGSACSSHAKHPSRALTAFGLRQDEIECSIRVSFSAENTREEVDRFVEVLSASIDRLVKIHR